MGLHCHMTESYEAVDTLAPPNQNPGYATAIANGTISPLVYRYVSAIVPLTSLLVLHAYGPWSPALPLPCTICVRVSICVHWRAAWPWNIRSRCTSQGRVLSRTVGEGVSFHFRQGSLHTTETPSPWIRSSVFSLWNAWARVSIYIICGTFCCSCVKAVATLVD